MTTRQQFHILRSTARTNADVFDALNALSLWQAFLPSDWATFLSEIERTPSDRMGYYRNLGYVFAWDKGRTVLNGGGSEVGKLWCCVLGDDLTNPPSTPLADRLPALRAVMAALPNASLTAGQQTVYDALFTGQGALKQLDGSSHILLVANGVPAGNAANHELAGVQKLTLGEDA